MINTTLCYITRGNDVLMLHRVKKKNDINKEQWSPSVANHVLTEQGAVVDVLLEMSQSEQTLQSQ